MGRQLLRPHICDQRCRCPFHDEPLIYSRAEDDHACQHPDCALAHGVNAILMNALSRQRD